MPCIFAEHREFESILNTWTLSDNLIAPAKKCKSFHVTLKRLKRISNWCELEWFHNSILMDCWNWKMENKMDIIYNHVKTYDVKTICTIHYVMEKN